MLCISFLKIMWHIRATLKLWRPSKFLFISTNILHFSQNVFSPCLFFHFVVKWFGNSKKCTGSLSLLAGCNCIARIGTTIPSLKQEGFKVTTQTILNELRLVIWCSSRLESTIIMEVWKLNKSLIVMQRAFSSKNALNYSNRYLSWSIMKYETDL